VVIAAGDAPAGGVQEVLAVFLVVVDCSQQARPPRSLS
jgi:hypothetical protein